MLSRLCTSGATQITSYWNLSVQFVSCQMRWSTVILKSAPGSAQRNRLRSDANYFQNDPKRDRNRNKWLHFYSLIRSLELMKRLRSMVGVTYGQKDGWVKFDLWLTGHQNKQITSVGKFQDSFLTMLLLNFGIFTFKLQVPVEKKNWNQKLSKIVK